MLHDLGRKIAKCIGKGCPPNDLLMLSAEEIVFHVRVARVFELEHVQRLVHCHHHFQSERLANRQLSSAPLSLPFADFWTIQ